MQRGDVDVHATRLGQAEVARLEPGNAGLKLRPGHRLQRHLRLVEFSGEISERAFAGRVGEVDAAARAEIGPKRVVQALVSGWTSGPP